MSAADHIAAAGAVPEQRIGVKVHRVGLGAKQWGGGVIESGVAAAVTTRDELTVLHHGVQSNLARRRATAAKAALSGLGRSLGHQK